MLMEKKNSNYNIILDVVRIAACVGVFSTHIWQVYGTEGNKLLDLVGTICRSGANGVVVLFCLSGYLAWKGINSDSFTRYEYWYKRLCRLTPSYYIVLILYILLGILPIDVGVLRYFTYTNGFIPSREFEIYNNMGGLWTMSCFVFFYLLAPYMKKYIHSLKSSVIALVSFFVFGKIFDLGLEIVLNFNSADRISDMKAICPVGNMYLFLLGIVVYYVLKEEKEYSALLIGTILLSIFLAVDKIDYPLWGIITAMMIILSAGCAVSMKMQGIVGRKIVALIRMGSIISYEVYLSHFLFIKLFQKIDILFELGVLVAATIIFSCLLHWVVDVVMGKALRRKL